jgi:hypothetical protein
MAMPSSSIVPSAPPLAISVHNPAPGDAVPLVPSKESHLAHAPPPAPTTTVGPTGTEENERSISLGIFLCRTILLMKMTSATDSGKGPDYGGGHSFLQTVVMQKLDVEQDASLLSFLLEHCRAYAMVQQQIKERSIRTTATATTTTTSTSASPFLESSPLPWLWHALVYCQERIRPLVEPSHRQRSFRCRIPNQNKEDKQKWEDHWHAKRHASLEISSLLVEQTIQALVHYGETILTVNTLTADEISAHDIQSSVYLFRILLLPIAKTIKLGEEFTTLLWQWVARHLSSHVKTVSSAPRRIRETIEGPCFPLNAVTIGLCLGRSRCLSNNVITPSSSTSWIRVVVGVTSDWVHFKLLPCFQIFQPHQNDAIDRNHEDVDHDEMASLACEIVQLWQSLGVDNDWLRTQLEIPRSEESEGNSSIPTNTHATSILELSTRLLQAIALEEKPGVRKSFKSLKDYLLQFLGPVVTQHPNWLDTLSQLNYTSALAHLKTYARDELAQACWESAKDDPSLLC